MAKISQREKLLLGYASNSLSNSSSRRNSEVNFSDVFGGPPRRSSTHEFFQNEIGSTDCINDDVEINADVDSDARFPSSWLELGEKPVFGDQIGVRNRYSSQDFYDDIFGGDQPLMSCSLPPRIHMPGRNPFSSAPGSRPVSPSRPLPPGIDPSATLSKLSVPGRTSSTEIMASTSMNQSSKSSRRSISRLRQSSPNDLASFGKELTNNSKFNGTEYNAKPTMDSNENIQFHFSIYKWANKGVPIAMLSSKKRSPSRSKVEMITSERYLSSRKIDVIVNGASLSASKRRIQSNIQVRECKSEDAITKNVASDRLEGSKEVSDHSQKSLEQSSSKITKANFRSLSSLFREHKEENRKPSAVKGGKESIVNDETEIRSYKVNKTKVHGIDTSSGENKDVDKSQGRIKVKDFVKVFNQQSCPNAGSQSRSWRWKDITSAATIEAESDGKTRQAKADDEMQASFVSWGKTRSDSIREVDTISGSGSCSVSDTNASKSNKEPNKDVGESATKINVNCVVDNQQVNGVLEDSATESQETQSYERKVKQWSKGKERNIRALLSTLQYALWPNSGWKPIPLVDIIEANAVKKAYQRALLCLHPDKLQQKGAAPYQKLIAEKVFDILQEAWEQFNAIGLL